MKLCHKSGGKLLAIIMALIMCLSISPQVATANDSNITIVQTVNSTNPGGVVNIPDPHLLLVVRDSLNKPTGDITVSDMLNLTALNADNKGISNLSGLEYARNLQSLDLNNNQITNLSALAKLIKLVTLNISYNNLTDISVITGMPELKKLDFGCNQVSNIAPLAGLNKLEELLFYGNQVTEGDVSILSGKATIHHLHIDGINASDLSPLATLSNLDTLWANMNGISDLLPLTNLSKLHDLSLTDNQITNISALVNNRGFGEGTTIDLVNNPLGSQASADIQTLISRGVNVVLSLAYQSAFIDSSNKVVTLHFNKDIFNNQGTADDLKQTVTFSADGINFAALGANDTVAITGKTLVVTFATALSGSTNKINVAANAFKDADGNILSSDITTEPIEIAASLTPPALKSKKGATIGSMVKLTFNDNAAWRAAITEITVDGVPLKSTQYTVDPGKINIIAGVLNTSGKHTIIVSATGYTNATVTQTMVTVPVSRVTINKKSDTIAVGDSDQLTARITPTNATNTSVTWSSDNTAVATVSSTGLVKAVGAGAAKITVTSVDGDKTATCTVTVPTPVTGVSLNKTNDTIAKGGSDKLKASIIPTNAINKKVTWSSDNTAIATVSSTGLVKAVRVGTAIITVTTVDGGKTATCTVTVNSGG